MKVRKEKEHCKAVTAFGKADDSYQYGPFNFYDYRSQFITRYRMIGGVVFLFEMLWLIWPAISTSLYGAKAIFAWVAFGPVVLRMFFCLQSIIVEDKPFQITTSVFFIVPDSERNEQWLRWLGIHGQGRPHGTYSFFSKVVHNIILIVVLAAQIKTRNRFHTDYFWLINCVLCVACFFLTFSIGWFWIIYGIAQTKHKVIRRIQLD